MLLDEALFEDACEKLAFQPRPFHSLEVFTLQDGQVLVYETMVTQDNLDNWVNREGIFAQENDSANNVVGGVRILVFDQDPKDTLPFDADVFKRMTRRLCLPSSFADGFAKTRTGFLDYHLELTASRTGDGIGCSIVSPLSGGLALDLAICWNKQTSVTSGILRSHRGHEHSAISDLTSDIKRLASLSAHPLLVPALLCNIWNMFMTYEDHGTYARIRQIQKQTDTMDDFLRNFKHLDTLESNPQDYENVHKDIVLQNAYLTNGLSHFIKELGEELLAILELPLPSLILGVSEEIQADVDSFIRRLQKQIRCGVERRERLLQLLAIQMQSLGTLIQQRDSQTNLDIAKSARQDGETNLRIAETNLRLAEEMKRDSQTNIRIAEELKRDSAAMKSLALVTTIFLPMTALASIFSMDAFFSWTPGASLVVSGQSWIFWLCAVLLTILVLGIWTLWMRRKPSLRG